MTDLAALARAHRLRVHDIIGIADAVVVATSPAAVVYCGGYRSMGYDTDPGLRIAVVFDRKNWILVGPAADAWAATESGDGNLRYYGYRTFFFADQDRAGGLEEFRRFENFEDAVQAALDAIGGGRAPVAVEGTEPTAGLSQLATIDAAETEKAFRRARSIKDAAEIGLLREAAASTERALAQALAIARAGVTELELAAVISA
ncbi:MAG: hypothetical protein JNL61_09850, partial [Rhizobiaceae bacterium]|nr:hypothetical protein [Rhizobiaceae bacterium]